MNINFRSTMHAIGRHRPFLAVGLVGWSVLALNPSFAAALSNKVTAFNTKDYSTCGQTNMKYSTTAADNFVSKLTASGALTWTAGIRQSDGSVRGKDMGDPEFTGDSYYADQSTTRGFDGAAGIAMYQGHGGGSNPPSFHDGLSAAFEACNTTDPSKTCKTVPAGSTNPAVCLKFPVRSPCPSGESCWPASTGNPWCAYRFAHTAVLCTTESASRQRVSYSFASGESVMRLGETAAVQGPWAGAGDNGHVRMATILVSHAAHLGTFGHDLGGMFGGGMAVVSSIYTHGGDYADDPDRAPTYATFMHDNPDMALMYSWLSAGAALSSGGGCRGWKTDGTPHMGFNGCGGHLLMGFDTSQSGANNLTGAATPRTMQDGSVIASGSGSTIYRSFLFNSNWDATTYPGLASAWRF